MLDVGPFATALEVSYLFLNGKSCWVLNVGFYFPIRTINVEK